MFVLGVFGGVSIVEIFIALIVSCLPGFASFFKTSIRNTSFYKSLASLAKTRRTTSGGSTAPSDSESGRMRVTIGGTGAPGMANKKKKSKHGNRYYEAPDTVELDSSWTGSEVHEPALALLNDESRTVTTRSIDQYSCCPNERPDDSKTQQAERMV